MKYRVIQKEDGYYEPQYQKESKFGPQWCECHISNDLVYRRYTTVADAIKVCQEHMKLYPEPRVVWEYDSEKGNL